MTKGTAVATAPAPPTTHAVVIIVRRSPSAGTASGIGEDMERFRKDGTGHGSIATWIANNAIVKPQEFTAWCQAPLYRGACSGVQTRSLLRRGGCGNNRPGAGIGRDHSGESQA
jgi:hypothetical protein